MVRWWVKTAPDSGNFRFRLPNNPSFCAAERKERRAARRQVRRAVRRGGKCGAKREASDCGQKMVTEISGPHKLSLGIVSCLLIE